MQTRLHHGWLAALLSATACSTSPGAHPSNASAGATQGAAGGLNLNITPEACPDAGSRAMSDAGACVPTATRHFAQDIAPLFNSCAGEICHSFGAGAITQQVGVPSVECCGELPMIDPGHPERSYVLQKLRGTLLCGGDQMPLDQPPFTADDVQAISDWICQGAGTAP